MSYDRQAAERGHALIKWYGDIEETDADSPQDIIADLLHALNEENTDPVDIVYLGISHFQAEIDSNI